jgi:hypothetical protein
LFIASLAAPLCLSLELGSGLVTTHLWSTPQGSAPRAPRNIPSSKGGRAESHTRQTVEIALLHHLLAHLEGQMRPLSPRETILHKADYQADMEEAGHIPPKVLARALDADTMRAANRRTGYCDDANQLWQQL